MAIDAYVETSVDDGKTWARSAEWRADAGNSKGPWSVPHAVEIARHAWAVMLQMMVRPEVLPPSRVRVVDLAGVVVEQWPKVS